MKLLKTVKHWLSKCTTLLFRCLPLHKRVFFYTIRSNGTPLENLKCVYDRCDHPKILFARMLPHSFRELLRARYNLLTSRVIVTDDYIRYLRQVRLRKGQKVIQIWHAAGAFKKFGLDAPSALSREDELATHAQYTDVCVSADGVRDAYVSAFGVHPDVVKPLGVPRTDQFFDEAACATLRDRFFATHPEFRGKRIYVYFPTFREIDGIVTDFDPQIDFSALYAALRWDEVFLVRRHPVMQHPFFEDGVYDRLLDVSDVSTSELLIAADVVLTDYSSVIFDAALLGKKIVFYCPDLASYERAFYLDLKELPGEIVTDAARLPEVLRAPLNDAVAARCNAFFDKELSACDGHSTARVIALIDKYMK